MDKYSIARKCPKCGNDYITTTYCKGETCDCPAFPVLEKEHLDRACGCCGYRWVEACLKASK